MKKINFIFVSVFILVFHILIFAQDKRYTHGAENGYMWIDFEKYSIMRDMKYDYLSSMLERQRVINLFQFNIDSLGCRDDIKNLLEQNKSNDLDLNMMVKKIDQFYSDDKLRIVPIAFAYCYCIKELSGRPKKELAEYLMKILKFSESEQ
ncbi:Hypothetical protein IALB_0280 [Ignavibacterium album JCM 16511]|uniref:Uncharacterized protein n=1 Tax=Ignavibacterium album (strain DSM 19864 / JCM 16511 / NBRC 101810 / Mat9-16) TaxID=945713 RepID=I0AG85_IGNAJ|nr:hypothetical protein [Ignavibacterium album]AFH47992.1 Hypothetical protein IALB_0280 [Ignavibacterium album JCM 16511]